nr:protein ENHANCED DISEASE RESISTANCE 2-like isoform X5 [Ipomoea batatas]
MKQKRERLLALQLERPKNGWRPLIMLNNRQIMSCQEVPVQGIS